MHKKDSMQTCGGFMRAWMSLDFCRQEFQADGGLRMNLSRTQKGLAQACQAEQTTHDTNHILHSHHANIFPSQGVIPKDGGSSEFFSLLASTSEF